MPSSARDRLQPLADALAAAVAVGRTSAACAAALHRLLPGLRYCSVAMSNPSGNGGDAPAIVATANCAVEGPTMLHLFDAGSSAAGLALARGHPLKAQLRSAGREESRAAARVLSALADVQQLVVAAPGAQHVLCIPFGSAAGRTATHGPGNCQLCRGAPRTQGKSSGALLVGLEASPQDRHLAVLHTLAHCLHRSMGPLQVDTLAFVNFACSSSPAADGSNCCCCCQPDEEEEEEGLQDRANFGGGSGGDGAGPSMAPAALPLLVGPAEEAPALDAAASGDHGAHATAGSFSKALQMAAAMEEENEGEGGELLRQSRWSLRFQSELAEREYALWMAPVYSQTDRIASLLMLVAMVVVSFAQSFRLHANAPATLCLASGMVLPLAFSFAGKLMGKQAYAAWRESFLLAFRLYAIVFACVAGIPAYQAHLRAEQQGHWVTFWRLTGAEALFASAIAFLLPQRHHVPLQLAGLAVALGCLPRMCSESRVHSDPGACLKQSAIAVAGLGLLIPTTLLRGLERWQRTTFARMVRTAARRGSAALNTRLP